MVQLKGSFTRMRYAEMALLQLGLNAFANSSLPSFEQM